jgi:putative membrane protein
MMTNRAMYLLAAIALTTAHVHAGPVAEADQRFVTEAASGGLMEVELGRMAASQASSERVKQFGKRMVDDHRKANAELKQLARQESIELPKTMSPKHQAMVDRLGKVRAAEFDRAYMEMMVEDHAEDVEKFREHAQSAKDPDIKAFAARNTPTLEAHLKLANDINAEVKSATSGARPSAD